MDTSVSVIGRKKTVTKREATERKMVKGHIIENFFLEKEYETKIMSIIIRKIMQSRK